jgi:DNA-binding NarL/FixJ family response regulator
MGSAMPGLDGIDAKRQNVASHPATRVLILTMSDDGSAATRALRAGADGYLVKGTGGDDARETHSGAAGSPRCRDRRGRPRPNP